MSRGMTVPAHCDVKATAQPTSDSEIKFEVWLPASGWNGKYQQVGNGGWAGSIPVGSFAEPLRSGYAVAGTDDGHTARGAEWAIGHPEKLIDFGYRAVHETELQATAIVQAFYGKESRAQLLRRLFRRRTRSAHGSAALCRRLRRHRRRRSGRQLVASGYRRSCGTNRRC